MTNREGEGWIIAHWDQGIYLGDPRNHSTKGNAMTKRKSEPLLAWGGFCDDELEHIYVDTGFGGFNTGKARVKMPAIFKARELARVHYEDVRRVEIREVKP